MSQTEVDAGTDAYHRRDRCLSPPRPRLIALLRAVGGSVNWMRHALRVTWPEPSRHRPVIGGS